MRTLVMGDIHGAYAAMKQCFERSNFDYENDRLIQLGDVADGYDEVYECVEELLKIKHLVAVKGNHDDWFDQFIQTDYHPCLWNLGGRGTLISYLNYSGKTGRYFQKGNGYKTALVANDIPKSHKTFFAEQKLYYIDEHNRCFVHAGFDYKQPFYNQKSDNYCLSRSFWNDALKQYAKGVEWETVTSFSEIFIGHTSTTQLGIQKPLNIFNIWNMDTGAGMTGRLTIMDADTKEFWQSDLTSIIERNYKEQ